jgi:anti-sigma-K factor RskA
MRNENNDCIRYLMKEMDPSEELLMERAMMEDEDLLIEVESMRQTLKKLDKLPEKNPPSELSDQIMEQAAAQAQKNRASTISSFKPAFKYAVAATIALTLTAGGAWFYIGSEGDNRQQLSTASTSNDAETEVTTGSSGFALDTQLFQTIMAQEEEVEPWVDRNNVLHFNGQTLDDTSYEALLEESQQKLRLIEQPSVNSRPARSFQLTGSSN